MSYDSSREIMQSTVQSESKPKNYYNETWSGPSVIEERHREYPTVVYYVRLVERHFGTSSDHLEPEKTVKD